MDVLDDQDEQLHELLANEVIPTVSNSSRIIANDTSNPAEIDSFYFYQAEQFTILWILLISIVCGNGSVLVALFFNKSNKSRMNYFIKQLAIADLLVGLISVLTDIIWRITVTWHGGHVLCKLVRFAQAVVTYSSTYVLVALSIDRYDAIRHPMNFSGSWKRARLLVGSAWVLSMLFSTPMLVFYREETVQGQLQCWIEFSEPWHWKLYMTLISVALFIIPTIIITSCYAIIVATIWTKSKIMTPKKRNNRHNGLHESDSKRASSRGLIPRAKIKTIKMTFVIVFVFIICWSPYIIFDLLQVYGHIPKTQTNIAVATFIQSLTPLNSAANPIIYCVFSTHICRTLRTIAPFKWFLCWCGKGRSHRGLDSQEKSRTNTRSTSMSEILTMNPRKHNHSATFQTTPKAVQVLLPPMSNADLI